MFGNVEAVKKNNKMLDESRKNFTEIETIVSALVGKNASENMDFVFTEKFKKDKKDKVEKFTGNSDGKILEACTNPRTSQYMKASVLPSKEHWLATLSGNTNDTTIKPVHEIRSAQQFSLQNFPSMKSDVQKQTFVKIGTYVFTENTEISGLNQHITNPDIFFLVSPCNGYLHKISEQSRTEKEYMEERKHYGKLYLADAINYVKKTVHSETKINCLVLGDRSMDENMEVYDPRLIVNKNDDCKQHIKYYYYPKEELAATTDVGVYNIDAHGHEMALTSTDLATLHTLAVRTNKNDGTGEAIIVHCQQGLDRTGMLIFAFILFQNYDNYFSGKDRTGKIYDAYKTLQWSRSPMALTKIADFANAIFLAQALKAIDIEKKCVVNLHKMVFMDKLVDEKKQALILQVIEAISNKEKLEILDNELKKTVMIKKGRDYTTYESPQRRPRSNSCHISTEELPIGSVKKSSSEPDDLYSSCEKSVVSESKSEHKIDKSRSTRNTGSFFTKKTKKTSFDTASELDSPNEIRIQDDNKHETLLAGSTAEVEGSLSPILERRERAAEADFFINKENAENGVMLDDRKSFKHSSSLFSLKNRKRSMDGFKGTDVRSDLNTFLNELVCLKNAVQFRVETEAALQQRIQPMEIQSYKIS